MQLRIVETRYYTRDLFSYLFFYFPFSSIYVTFSNDTSTVTSETDFHWKIYSFFYSLYSSRLTNFVLLNTTAFCWTGQSRAERSGWSTRPTNSQIGILSVSKWGVTERLLCRWSSTFSKIFSEKCFSCIIHIVIRYCKQRWALIL